MCTVTLRPRSLPGAAVRAGMLAVAAARIARGARRTPPIGTGIPTDVEVAPFDPTDVTVVIPARDEADRIGPCVRALVPAGARVIVVDDGSTDATRDVAEDAGATVIDAGPLPPGWAGKAHALQVGLGSADTPIVVAVDADTRPGPRFLPSAAGALGSRTLVTAGARVDAPDPLGRLVHASMLATLVYRFGPPGVAARSVGRTMANGQCMVMDRRAVLAAGGFAAVAGSLTEDVALARRLAGAGHGVAFEDGTGVIDVEGYGSARDTLDGWGRSLALREVTTAPWMLADLAVLWTAFALPQLRLATGRGDVVDVAALGLRAGVAAATSGAFREGGWSLALAPVADLAVVATLTRGAIRPDRSWKGRDYERG